MKKEIQPFKKERALQKSKVCWNNKIACNKTRHSVGIMDFGDINPTECWNKGEKNERKEQFEIQNEQ